MRLDWLTSTLSNSIQSNSNKQQKITDEDDTSLLKINFNMPLNIFSKSFMLQPYLSLHYLEYLTRNIGANGSNIKGYLIGATNFLFKQRLQPDLDALIETNQILIVNNSLKKQLQLTTADLRFADYLTKNVNAHYANKSTESKNPEVELNSTADWEGSDEWIRLHFKWYLYSLLASVEKSQKLQKQRISSSNSVNSSDFGSIKNPSECEEANIDDFNLNFVSEFINTDYYQAWSAQNSANLSNELKVFDKHNFYKISHPFNGQLNIINDIKLRFMHTFQSTDSGRNLNKALAESGKLVTNTGKAVAGGFNKAKSTFSSFLNNLAAKN